MLKYNLPQLTVLLDEASIAYHADIYLVIVVCSNSKFYLALDLAALLSEYLIKSRKKAFAVPLSFKYPKIKLSLNFIQ